MTRLEELALAIESLPESEYSQFRRWFLERDWEKWDRQIEADSTSGKLNFLVEEARDAKAKRILTDLRCIGLRNSSGKDGEDFVWAWIGSHGEYDRIVKGR